MPGWFYYQKIHVIYCSNAVTIAYSMNWADIDGEICLPTLTFGYNRAKGGITMITISHRLCKLACLLSLVVLAAGVNKAQAQSTVNEPVGGGTLSFTLTPGATGVCGEYNIHYQTWYYTSFQFTYQGKIYPLVGSLTFLTTPAEPNSLGCPSPGPTVLTLNVPTTSGACQIAFTAQNYNTTEYGGTAVYTCPAGPNPVCGQL